MKGLTGAESQAVQAVVKDFTKNPPVLKVWLDANHLLQREEVSISMSASGGAVAADVIIDFSDYGTPITVTYAGNTFALLDDYAPDPLTDSSQVTDIVSPFGGVVAGTVTASTASSPAVTKSVPLTGVIQSGTFVLSNTENVSGMQYGAVDISTPIDRAGQPNIVVPPGTSSSPMPAR